MPFVLPTFNLNCNVWHSATWTASYPPVVPAPDFVVVCNLAFSKRFQDANVGYMQLLVPALTDLRDGIREQSPLPDPDIVEVPAGSGRYYFVSGVDDIGKGFANEHRCASIDPYAATAGYTVPPWPVPYP